MKLYLYHYDKHREDLANMKLEFKKKTEDIEISSEQYSQFQREHDEKIRHLKTEFKQKFEKEKDHLIGVSKKNRECCICLGTLYCDDAKPAKPLWCAHDAYHEHCIKRWLKNEKTCPECRADCTIPEIKRNFYKDLLIVVIACFVVGVSCFLSLECVIKVMRKELLE